MNVLFVMLVRGQGRVGGPAAAAAPLTLRSGLYSEDEAMAAVAYASAVTCAGAPGAAATQRLERWRCGVCEHGYAPVPAPPRLDDVSVLLSGDGINRAFVGVDERGGRLVVAFRGSVEWTQWLFDLDALLVPRYASEGCEGCLVHQGFAAAWDELAAGVVRAVEAKAATLRLGRVLVTGHSLGAALALHAALALRRALPSLELEGYTFGQPRAGNAPFARWAQARLPAWFRVVNYLDPVAQAFKLPGYRHTTREVWYTEPPRVGQRPGTYTVLSSTDGEDPQGQNSKCGGLKLCLDGTYHVTYLNMPDITNETAVC